MTTTHPSSEGATRRTAGPVGAAVVRAVITEARGRGYAVSPESPTVVGIFGDPATARQIDEMTAQGDPVDVVPVPSSLAALAAVRAARPGRWTVLVTDRTEQQLSVDVLASLVGATLRTPDPWEAVRTDFAARGIEADLHAAPHAIDLALGLLQARPASGWPPVASGSLTRDHALGAVARTHLHVPAGTVDITGVLRWTRTPGLAGSVARLRAEAGDVLTDAVLAWVAGRADAAGSAITALLRGGHLTEVVPAGLALHVLTAPDAAGPEAHTALGRVLGRYGLAADPEALRRWAGAAADVVGELLAEHASADVLAPLLDGADTVLADAGGQPWAISSDLLPSALRLRLHRAAEAVREALLADGSDSQEAQVLRARHHSPAVETSWAAVEGHQLSGTGAAYARAGADIPALHAAVRLTRWLAAQESSAPLKDASPARTLNLLALRHARHDAWADAAVNALHRSSADAELAQTLSPALAAVRGMRDAHDLAFAAALAAQTPYDREGDRRVGGADAEQDGVGLIEGVLPDAVLPLAKHVPVLMIVLDGMSAGVAAPLMEALTDGRYGWQEALLPDHAHRHAVLAALPTLTRVSRTALLTGSMTEAAGQPAERTGFTAAADVAGLGVAALFHKADLEEARGVEALPPTVSEAIADTTGRRLVGCVLNTIDDALDKADPGRATWQVSEIAHLRALLDAANQAGRAVVVTSDHGHVVERRDTEHRPAAGADSARSRRGEGEPHGDEVLVSGVRVRGGQAILPAVERLRYTGLKAGYHGGATPAEVVVPVVVLVPDTAPEMWDAAGLSVAPPQRPAWWDAPVAAAGESPVLPATPAETPPPTVPDADVLPPSRARAGVGQRVVASEMYADIMSLAGRTSVTSDQVAAAVDALARTPHGRLPVADLAATVGVPRAQASGVASQLSMLLNVDAYPVLRVVGNEAVLDLPLLREQFEIDEETA